MTIGEGAWVGAGVVVTRDVPAHDVVAANPARRLRSFAGPRDVERTSAPELARALDEVVSRSEFILGTAIDRFKSAFVRRAELAPSAPSNPNHRCSARSCSNWGRSKTAKVVAALGVPTQISDLMVADAAAQP